MKKQLAAAKWEYVTTVYSLGIAGVRCINLQRWGFETFVLRHKTVTSPLRCRIYVRQHDKDSK